MRLFYYPPRKKGEPQTVVHASRSASARSAGARPEGTTKVVRRQKDPTWRPPPSIIKEHRENGEELERVIGPGPDNPLGRYAFYLGWPSYMIHGTNKPAGVGLRSSHGCMRLYPEDIEQLFESVPIGTKVRVVNEPFVFGWRNDELNIQAFDVLEDDARDWKKAEKKLLSKSLGESIRKELKKRGEEVDWDLVSKFTHDPRGIPVSISTAGCEPRAGARRRAEGAEPRARRRQLGWQVGPAHGRAVVPRDGLGQRSADGPDRRQPATAHRAGKTGTLRRGDLTRGPFIGLVLESPRTSQGKHNKKRLPWPSAASPASRSSEQGGADNAIERVPTGVAAFVGRTLKGPVNRPVLVASFAEFQQHFGGLWQPSTLSYAVEQFFENGGGSAYIVRVVNGAKPPTLTLPADGSQLRLVGAQSGLARIPARLGGLRRHRPERARPLQPGDAARAHRGLRADRGSGDLPPPVGAARVQRLRDQRAARVAPCAGRRARCRPSGRIARWALPDR